MVNRQSAGILVALVLSCSLATSAAEKDSSISRKLTSGPKAAAGAVAGVMIGVPVKISQESVRHTRNMRHSLRQTYEVDNTGMFEGDRFGRFCANCLSAPFGLVSGVITGTIKGAERGVKVGRKQPFSKASFSMEEPKGQSVARYRNTHDL